MRIVIAALCGFLLDVLLGDPEWMPHPVVFMGKGIHCLERLLRRLFPTGKTGELAGGVILALVLLMGTLAFSWGLLYLAGLIHPALYWSLAVLWSWQVLAMRGLGRESRRVYTALTCQGLEEARAAVSRIVGRDTQALTEEGVIKATVETVAENYSDGVAAPLFYLVLGGAPLALCYKVINTMDSMVGYRNENYLYFGRAAARLDDAANFIPARISALLLILSAVFTGEDAKGAFRVWRRDRRKHASPNAAQTEAAMAGALGVELAGPAWYFGQYYPKPTIGDPERPIEARDILRANRMLYVGGVLALLLFSGLRVLLLRL